MKSVIYTLVTAFILPLIMRIQTINGTVTNFHKMDGEKYIYVTTDDSNGWALYDTGVYKLGDDVTIMFDTLGDNDLYNDVLINIKKND